MSFIFLNHNTKKQHVPFEMCLRFKTYCSLSLSLSFTNSRGVGVLSIFWKLEIKGSLEILLCDYLQKWLFPQCIERGFGHREESMKWQISDERAVMEIFRIWERGILCSFPEQSVSMFWREREREKVWRGILCNFPKPPVFMPWRQERRTNLHSGVEWITAAVCFSAATIPGILCS